MRSHYLQCNILHCSSDYVVWSSGHDSTTLRKHHSSLPIRPRFDGSLHRPALPRLPRPLPWGFAQCSLILASLGAATAASEWVSEIPRSYFDYVRAASSSCNLIARDFEI